MSDAKKDEKRDLRINSGRMKPQEFERNLWVCTVEPGTTKEDIMNPAFWANVAPSIKPYDRMEVRCDDGAFFAELLVLHSDRTFAKVRMLTFLDLQAKPEAAGDSKTKGKDKKDKTTTDEPVGEMDKYEYKFRGPQCKHSIIRKSDNAVMVEKLESKEAAIQWLTEFVNKAA